MKAHTEYLQYSRFFQPPGIERLHERHPAQNMFWTQNFLMGWALVTTLPVTEKASFYNLKAKLFCFKPG